MTLNTTIALPNSMMNANDYEGYIYNFWLFESRSGCITAFFQNVDSENKVLHVMRDFNSNKSLREVLYEAEDWESATADEWEAVASECEMIFLSTKDRVSYDDNCGINGQDIVHDLIFDDYDNCEEVNTARYQFVQSFSTHIKDTDYYNVQSMVCHDSCTVHFTAVVRTTAQDITFKNSYALECDRHSINIMDNELLAERGRCYSDWNHIEFDILCRRAGFDPDSVKGKSGYEIMVDIACDKLGVNVY